MTSPDESSDDFKAMSGPSADDVDVRSAQEYDALGETIGSVDLDTGTAAARRRIEIPDRVGRYDVRGLLGQGGFGAVYEAWDSHLQRSVAVKVPRFGNGDAVTAEKREEFLREARRLAQLTHPSVVTVFDVGNENGVCFIVSDFLKGLDLNKWLADRDVSWQQTAGIMASLAGALAAAHAVGIIHRDVKMANIRMTERTEGLVPVLVDFGLAVCESEEQTQVSTRGVVSGTPTFMSPEQATGQGHRIDGRTDIYSLGVVMYRMLCGVLPFRAESVRELLDQVIHDEPRPPRQFVRGIPREMERICLKAMSKKIADRYTTALDMAEDLERLLKDHETVNEPDITRAATQQPAVRVTSPSPSPVVITSVTGATDSKRKSSAGLRILIAEDHDVTRFKLKADLEKWGHFVVEAEDGQQAWELFQEDEFAVVITDWMMPGMDGVQLVQLIRSAKRADYVYVIMLTAKAEKHDIVAGMGAGADDFLGKPFHRDELNVRLRAARRITELTRQLGDSNRRMKRSLEAAAKIQRSFLPSNLPQVDGFEFAWNYSPSDELGGDMLNIVPLDEGQLGIYVLEVSGHGIPASLLSTTLCRELASKGIANSLLVDRDEASGTVVVREPVSVMQNLAKLFVSSKEAGQFITMLYGILNVASRTFRYASAGNPPVVVKSDGQPSQLQYASGMPFGLIPDNDDYEQVEIPLFAGDRFVICSDGVTDAQNPDGALFGSGRLCATFDTIATGSVQSTVDAISSSLIDWRGDAEATDDVSILAVGVS